MSETNEMECIPLMKEIRSTAPNGFARYDIMGILSLRSRMTKLSFEPVLRLVNVF